MRRSLRGHFDALESQVHEETQPRHVADLKAEVARRDVRRGSNLGSPAGRVAEFAVLAAACVAGLMVVQLVATGSEPVSPEPAGRAVEPAPPSASEPGRQSPATGSSPSSASPTSTPVPSASTPSTRATPSTPTGQPARDPAATVSVRVWFPSKDVGPDGCHRRMFVTRKVAADDQVQAALKATLSGPTNAERRKGAVDIFDGAQATIASRTESDGSTVLVVNLAKVGDAMAAVAPTCRFADVEGPLRRTIGRLQPGEDAPKPGVEIVLAGSRRDYLEWRLP
ncbi:MAG: hypothetical protein ACRCXL_13575 [Dermatophilaceae bacterium]